MKTKLKLIALTALVLTSLTPLIRAQLVIPGANGSDGALVVTSNTVIDLSQAATGSWDANNSTNTGKGIYDSNQWAVVFKYTSVTISNGATLSFANHASRSPVVWLVSGNVTIDGTLSLDGQVASVAPNLSEPGPGGFRGGNGYFTAGVGHGAGFGPGGGGNPDRYGGSYSTLGYGGSSTYGNPSLLPLLGGSGGSGDVNNDNYSTSSPQSGSGGGGGGAILIACSGTLNVGATGIIRADGGPGGDGSNGNHSAGGSGGGVRLACNTLAGSGIVRTLAGAGHHSGGLGRIRIERVNDSGGLQVTPGTSPVPLLAGDTALIWLPTNGPTARIVSIGATNPPIDPRASFGTFGADVTLPQVSTTPVIIETVNAESASTVKVRVTPRANGNFTETTAALTQTNSLNPLVLRWTADVPVNSGFSAVQVKVVRP